MMKSAVSFSKTWMRENFRRYWIVPVLGFMGYFLSSILPVLLCYQRFDIVSSYASISISNQNPAIIGIDCILAVLMAVCVFSYLHNSASVTMIHSFPSGRGQLFDASALSGFFMMLIPVAANGILMMSLSGARTDVSDTVASLPGMDRRDDDHHLLCLCALCTGRSSGREPDDPYAAGAFPQRTSLCSGHYRTHGRINVSLRIFRRYPGKLDSEAVAGQLYGSERKRSSFVRSAVRASISRPVCSTSFYICRRRPRY